MIKEIEFKPRGLQRNLLENKSRRQVVVAHRRFGKTTYALIKILMEAEKPNSRLFYIAPTYKQAKLIAYDMLVKMIPPELIVKKNEMDLMVKLSNGSTIELKGSDNPDSLRGVGLNGCVFDEYAQQNHSIYSEIIRAALTDKKGWALFIGTPKGKNHFFDLFMDTPEEDRVLLQAKDTNIISEEELALAKAEMSEDEYNQEFNCDFLYFSGQIYKEFNRDKHVIKPFPIDETWLRYASIDHGQVNPTAVIWIATDFDDKHYIFDEHYESGKTVQYHAKAIRDRGYNLKTLPYLDPSCFAKNRSKGDKMYSIADEYTDNGVPCMPAQNAVSAGINRVKEYLKNDKIFIFKNCENLIREIESYRWKDKKAVDSNLPEEPLKVKDHACDALRYYILSRPENPKWPKFKRGQLERWKELTSRKRDKQDWYSVT